MEIKISGSSGLPYFSLGTEVGQIHLGKLGTQQYADIEIKLGIEHTDENGSLQIAFIASATGYTNSKLNNFRTEGRRIFIGPFPIAEVPAGGFPNPDPESVLPGKRVGQADIGAYLEYRNNAWYIKKVGVGITGNVQANAATNPPGRDYNRGEGDLGSVYLKIGF